MITPGNVFQHPPTSSQNEYKPDPSILTQKVKMIYKQLYRKAHSYSLFTINVSAICWCFVFFFQIDSCAVIQPALKCMGALSLTLTTARSCQV